VAGVAQFDLAEPAVQPGGGDDRAGPDGPPIVLRHQGCGRLTEAYLACRECGEEITAHNVTPEPGPGFGAAR